MSAGKGFGRGLKFDLPPAGGAPATPPVRPAEPVTGLMRTVGIAQDLHALRAQVQQLEGERGAQPLDPKTIRASRWANRHESSFLNADFEVLKAEIADAGGNVQPIKVRPLPAGEGARYEIVFGHRRHRACLDLGLPVLAVVQEVDERGLWVEMERENRSRANLSAWEQGMMYRRALDAGLFPTQVMLAKAIGRGPTDVSEALRIAGLPDEVVAAFPSPNDIQFRWSKPLTDAIKRDRNGVIAAAVALAGRKPNAAEAFAALVAPPAPPEIRPSYLPQRVDLGGKARAEIHSEGREIKVQFDAPLSPVQWAALEKVLRKITSKAGMNKT